LFSHWITRAFFLDGKQGMERLGRSRALQGVLREPEVIVNGRKIAVARHVVEEYRGRFPAALNASIKLGVCLGGRLGFEVCPRQIEMHQPRIRGFLRILKRLESLANLAAL